MMKKFISVIALLLVVTTGAKAQTTHTVTAQEGSEDAAKWTVIPNPVAAGQRVKVTNIGSKMVKSVKAKKKVASAPSYDQKRNIADGAVTVATGEHWLIEGDGSVVSNTITIGDSATVTLSNVNISDSSTCITCSGSATIILADGTTNTLTSTGILNDTPVLAAGPTNTTLTIQGSTGSLNASSNGYGAGIGGGFLTPCGNIVIEGGNITATGGYSAAGIGSGHKANCGNILISGGTITASSNMYGAGIGSGHIGSCGGITINGGTVSATGGYSASGIGCGQIGACGDITIENTVTVVTATKGYEARYSIGSGGDNRKCGTVTISGSVTGNITTSPCLITGAQYEGSTFNVTLGESDHGSVELSVNGAVITRAKKSDVVTISVNPDEGYAVKNVTAQAYTSWGAAVRARRAPELINNVDVQKQADGTWQFTMKEADVWVVVTYTKELQDAWIQPIGELTYTGEAQTPAVVVKDGDTILSAETDYTVTYADNVNVGLATVTVSAREGSAYSGMATATFRVIPDMTNQRITLTIPAKSYVARIDEDRSQIETEVDGVAIYSVKNVYETEVELTEPLTLVPAQTPYLIYNDNDVEMTISIITSDGEPDNVEYDSEHFKGTLTDKTFTEEDMQESNHYVLSNGNNFVWVKEAGTLIAGKCWIEFPVAEVHSQQIVIVSECKQVQAGISSIDSGETTSDNWYDLSGRRVARATKGICVRNGKMVVVK